MGFIPQIKKCRSCGDKHLSKLLETKYCFPDERFQIYMRKPTPNLIKASLILMICEKCGLVQLKEKIEPTGYEEYLYVGTPSESFRDYLKGFSTKLATKYGVKSKKVLDIGCSDGYLLNLLGKYDNKVVGFEPSKTLAQVCRTNNLEVICDFFNPKSAKEKLATTFDCIIIRHTLEHLNDLDDILRPVRAILNGDGIFVIEVPYLNSIIRRGTFTSFQPPHVNYFTLKSLNHLLKKHDLFISDAYNVDIGGGSIVVIAKKTQSEFDSNDFEINDLRSFLSEFGAYFDKVKKVIKEAQKRFRNIAAFGASDRAYSFMNFADLRNVFTKIYDSNEYLWGSYLGGFNYLIEDPRKLREDRPDCLAVLASSFEEEIIEIGKNQGIKNFISMLGEPRIIKE